MKHRPWLRLLAAAGAASALPATAHLASAAAPHWHASDAWGVLAVLGLTAAAAGLDRLGRRGR